MRLLILANSSDVEILRNRLRQNLFSVGDIFPSYKQLHASNRIRPEPVDSHSVGICERAFDSSRIQAPFCQQCLRQISKLADDSHVSKFNNAVVGVLFFLGRVLWRRVTRSIDWLRRYGSLFDKGRCETALGQFSAKSLPGETCQFVGLPGNLFQLPIHLARVERFQPLTLLIWVNHRHGRASYSNGIRVIRVHSGRRSLLPGEMRKKNGPQV